MFSYFYTVGGRGHDTAGVSGTFGDSLPIESLIEASNETAKVGEVAGTLADALNWVGISEDEFNQKLAECTDESERNDLIMNTLAGTYEDASKAFYENNDALVEARDRQASLDDTMAGLGETIGDIKNRVLSDLLPSIGQLADAFGGILTGAPGAQQAMQQAIGGLISTVVSQLPGFINAGAQIIVSLATAIIQNIPQLLTAAGQIISNLVVMLKNNLPQILDAGMQMLQQLADGILQGLPQMIERLPELIDGILAFFEENFPAILEQGVEITKELAAGIIQAVPDLVAQLPDIITSIIDFLAENLPQIINSGIELTISLASGIIQAIPEIVKRLPEIIAAIASGLINVAGSLLETGAQLLTEVWNGISGWIGNLTENMGEVIDGIKTGLTNGISKVADVGRDIIEGLWNGISDMTSWIGDKIKGFGESVLGGIKSFFGIASPSRVMRDQVGVMLARGMADGMENGAKYVQAAASGIGTSIENEMARTNAQIGVGLAEDMQRYGYNMQQSLPTLDSTMSGLLSGVVNGIGTAMAGNTAAQPATIVFQVNGADLVRAILPDLRFVERSNPIVVSGV